MTRNPQPDDDSIDVSNDAVAVPDGRVGGVVLAAGESRRFDDGNKLLASVEGTPIVRRSAATLLDSQLDDVVALVGHEAEVVRDALDGLEMAIRRNEEYTEGQSTSVREGIAASRERGWDAAVFALGDMPFVSPSTVNTLLDAYTAGEGSIIAAAYEGMRGNPVLFDASHFDALMRVTGDRGGRRILEKNSDTVLVETGDPGTIRDIDSETDLKRYTERGCLSSK